MSLDRKLDAWIAAGIIDGATADRIRAFEDAGERPYVLWAVVGLGLFALALGVMLIVAANWELIPAWAKLVTHWLLTAAAAGAVWRGITRQQRWLAEAALFVLAVLVLAGIALHAQVYQQTGPVWHALLLWLVLAAPALLALGRTRLTGFLLAGLLLWMFADLGINHDRNDQLAQQSLALAGPGIAVLVALLPGLGRHFADGVREVGIAAMLGGASLAHFAWADDVTTGDAADMALRLAGPAVAAAAAWAAGRRWQRIPVVLLLPLLAGPLVAVTLATAVPHGDGWAPRLVGALVFAAMWGWIAAAASAAGWRVLFGVAIAAIAIRIFIIYFELFGTLATTGSGLIAGGLLLIALALGWRRVLRLADASA
jgi:uncharacterized membrane protein